MKHYSYFLLIYIYIILIIFLLFPYNFKIRNWKFTIHNSEQNYIQNFIGIIYITEITFDEVKYMYTVSLHICNTYMQGTYQRYTYALEYTARKIRIRFLSWILLRITYIIKNAF